MPLIKVEVVSGKTVDYKKKALECVYSGLAFGCGIDETEWVQRVTEIPQDNLDISSEKTKDFILVEITLFSGRNAEQKERAIKSITEKLTDELGIWPSDVYIVIYETPIGNFGNGGKVCKKEE